MLLGKADVRSSRCTNAVRSVKRGRKTVAQAAVSMGKTNTIFSIAKRRGLGEIQALRKAVTERADSPARQHWEEKNSQSGVEEQQ